MIADWVRSGARPALHHLSLFHAQARSLEQQPAGDLLGELHTMLLHPSQGFTVVSNIVDHGLTVSAAHTKEELVEGAGHLHLVIILEGLGQLVQDHGESILGLRSLVDQGLDLTARHAREAAW